MIEHTITRNNIHIVDSYTVRYSCDMQEYLYAFYLENPNSDVWNRSFDSMIREWLTHNFFYSLHLFRSRTKDADLNYPLTWYEKLGYTIIGGILNIFF